jgi:hypothetical protein
VQLTAEQMKAALGRVLGVIRDSNDPNALQPLLKAVQLIPVQLIAEQVQSAVGHVLDVIRDSTASEDWILAWPAFASKDTDIRWTFTAVAPRLPGRAKASLVVSCHRIGRYGVRGTPTRSGARLPLRG